MAMGEDRLYRELKEICQQMHEVKDELKEEISLLRNEVIEHRIRINNARHWVGVFYGILGGAVSAICIAAMDIYLKK